MDIGDLTSDVAMAKEDVPPGSTDEGFRGPNKPSFNPRKAQEEYDVVKAKLIHQDFNPADYHDPLLPRTELKPQFNRQFPPDAEKRLEAVLEAGASNR